MPQTKEQRGQFGLARKAWKAEFEGRLTPEDMAYMEKRRKDHAACRAARPANMEFSTPAQKQAITVPFVLAKAFMLPITPHDIVYADFQEEATRRRD